MNINSLNYNRPHKQAGLPSDNLDKHKYSSSLQDYKRERNCKDGLSYNENFKSGNIAMKSKVTALNFNGKGSKIFKSDGFANFLENVDSHNQTYNALVALVMAGLLRPTFTMVVPGVKDKKDKIYSAAQAISSGVLGFGVTMLLTRPLDDALRKAKNPLNDKKDADALKKIMKNVPEWIICVPRAMLTIALIPFILKYVFGLEKASKNGSKKQDAQLNDYNNLKTGKDFSNFGRGNKSEKTEVSFGARIPSPDRVLKTADKDLSWFGKQYDKFTNFIAKNISEPIMGNKALQSLAHGMRDSDYLFTHIATVTSFAISTTYATRTLQNQNLEEDKRKILALNQGLTFLISTAFTYLLDSKLERWWQRLSANLIAARTGDEDFAKQYQKVQAEAVNRINEMKKNKVDKKIIRDTKVPKAITFAENKKLIMPPNMKNIVNGFEVLKKMLIIGSVHRLAVPVFVTPVAANLGDKYLQYKRNKNAER